MKAILILFGCLGFVCLSTGVTSLTHGQRSHEQFIALAQMPAVNGAVMVGPGATANINIYLDSYSTDEEVSLMAAKFTKGGHKALRSAFEKTSLKGRIAMSDRNGYYELKLVRSNPTENGRRVFAVGERAMRFLDGYYSGRSKLDEFGILQLELHTENGIEQGTGTLFHAVRIKTLSGDRIVLDDHGIQPVRLRVRKP
ncbi:MAG TPA: hypothetical protein VNG71_16665 [Pyrinomonadaceae bacterium]|nr:hypothetical protein [Pyrinomonadaceae bacterium]